MMHSHASFLSTPKQSLKKLTLLGLCTALPLLVTGCATNNSAETSETQISAPVVTEQAQALYEQGLKLFNGEDTAQNKKQAFELFHKAAMENHTNAQGMLANMYASGQGVIMDYDESAKWAHKAAEKGHFEAQSMLGLMYANGKGVTKDRDQAIKWLKKAAEKGDPNIQVMLGATLLAEKQNKQAVAWFQKAADQNSAGGQYMLSIALGANKNIKGVLKDESRSIALMKQSAWQNYEPAQHFLGIGLANGIKLTDNDKEAALWLQKAALKGNTKAQQMLNKMKEEGRI